MGWFNDIVSGAVDTVTNVVDTVGDVGQGVVNAVSDAGVAIDQTVRDVIPGGWTTAALIAAGGYYAPEIGAWVGSDGATIAGSEGIVPEAGAGTGAGAASTPVPTGSTFETALSPSTTTVSADTAATNAANGIKGGLSTAAGTDPYALNTVSNTNAAMGGGTGLLSSAAVPAAADMGGAAGLTTAAAGGGILAETGVAGTGAAAATGGVGAGIATGVSGETGSVVAGTGSASGTDPTTQAAAGGTTAAGGAAAAATPWEQVLTTTLSGVITNAITGGNASMKEAILAADPFSSQRSQYQKPLNDMMTGTFKPTDPSYDWRFKQGEQALQRSVAAKGMLNSGNFLTALTDYGQGQASTEYQAQFNRLATLSGATSGSPGTAGNIAAGAANANTAAAGTISAALAPALVGWANSAIKP